MPSDKPEDTYAGVAAMVLYISNNCMHMQLLSVSWLIQVEEKRKEDAADGNEVAIQLEGKINRKVPWYYITHQPRVNHTYSQFSTFVKIY